MGFVTLNVTGFGAVNGDNQYRNNADFEIIAKCVLEVTSSLTLEFHFRYYACTRERVLQGQAVFVGKSPPVPSAPRYIQLP